MAEISVKCVCIAITFLAIICSVANSDGGKPCPGSTPDMEAMKLAPCAQAVQNTSMNVPRECCDAVEKMLQKSPKCLCAVIQSDTAKSAGINMENALTIPKRCKISAHNRHSGEKCGDYTIP